jgi:hypothetical protein
MLRRTSEEEPTEPPDGTNTHKAAHDSQPSSMLERMKLLLELNVFDDVRTLLGIGALVVYGIVRSGLDAFYHSLGVRTEDVGLTQIVIIARAAQSFVYALIVGALIMAIIAGLLSSRLRRMLESAVHLQQEEQRERSRSASHLPKPSTLFYIVAWTGVVTVGLMLFLAAVMVKVDFFPSPGGPIAPLFNVLLTLAIGLGFGWFVVRSIGQQILALYVVEAENPSSSSTSRIRSFLSVMLITVGLLTGLLILIVPYFSGTLIARDVMAGRPYVPRYFVGLPSLGSLDVRAECVSVKSKTTGRLADEAVAPNRILYLGHDDSFLVFYQTGVGPLRLPSGDFIISSVDAAKC